MSIVVLALASCRSDPELTPGAPFIDFSYDVPEVYLGPLEDPSAGRLDDYSVLPSSTGVAVLTTIKRATEEGNKLCCLVTRLTNLDSAGVVQSQTDVAIQSPGTHGLAVIPLRLDAQSISVAVIEETLVRLKPDDRFKTRTRQLWLAQVARDSAAIARTPAQPLPNGIFVEDGWARDDGVTILAGSQTIGKESAAWFAALSPDGALAWQRSYPPLPYGAAHAHTFTDDDTLILHARAPRWTDRGSEHILTKRTINLKSGELSETTAFDLRLDQLSDSPLGKVRPAIHHAARLPGGDTIIPLAGWFRGKFEKLRVARIGGGGTIKWINILNEGKGELVPQMAVDRAGEIAITGSDGTSQVLYRVGPDGETVAKHRIQGMTVRQITSHPEGGFLIWAKIEGKSHSTMSLQRIKAWPPA